MSGRTLMDKSAPAVRALEMSEPWSGSVAMVRRLSLVPLAGSKAMT